MKEAFEKPERTKLRIEQLYGDNQAKDDLLQSLEASRAATEAALRDKEKRNSELKQRLLDLRKVQERVGDRLNDVKAEQARLKELLEERTAQTMLARQDCAKIRPYTQQSSGALEGALRDLNATLAQDKAGIEALDRRARALQASTDTFGVVGADVQACTRLLGDVQAELAKEDEELAKAARHRDALSERSNNVRDVERQEKLLQRQLASINGRTEKLRSNADEKAEQARLRMEELKGVHRKLTEERQDKGRDIERRRVKIEQTEKKVRQFFSFLFLLLRVFHHHLCFSPVLKALQSLFTNAIHRWRISRRTSKTRCTPREKST
jgi:kinetochore protein Nuf2